MDDLKRRLTILDVGHGNSAVLEDGNGVVVLDTARGSGLLEFLRERRIRRLDTVLLSHADQDHIGGLTNILASREIEIGEVRLNTDSLKGSEIWDDLLASLNERSLAGELRFEPHLTRDTSGRFSGETIRIEILAPSPYLAGRGPGSTDQQGRRITSNSISAVIRLLNSEGPIALFPGDLDELGLDSLVGERLDARAFLLVFPHHGGRPRNDPVAFAEKLCELVQPEVVVFSIGRGRFNTPLPEVVAAVRRQVSSVRIACTQLSEHCASQLPSEVGSHLVEHFAQGRQTRACCGGSLMMNLEQDQELHPDLVDHLVFIERFAPQALCRRRIG